MYVRPADGVCLRVRAYQNGREYHIPPDIHTYIHIHASESQSGSRKQSSNHDSKLWANYDQAKCFRIGISWLSVLENASKYISGRGYVRRAAMQSTQLSVLSII